MWNDFAPSFSVKCALKREAGAEHTFEAHALLSDRLVIEAALSETNFGERPRSLY